MPGSRRLSIAAVAALVLVGSLVVIAPPAVAAPVSCVDVQPEVRAAAAMAARCGRSVEDLSARTPWSQTSVGADGLRQLASFVQPRWVRRADGSWTGVDTTLRRSGGAVVPGATVVPVVLSAGGSGPLARITQGGVELAMSWPQPLPAPVLVGDTAVYPDVYPEVDLRVTATALGLSEVLVVKTREAAQRPELARVRFGLATRGLSVRAAPGGGVEAVGPGERVVFVAPPPMMWDSSGDGGDQRTVAMPVQVGGGELAVIPDAGMLADPATRFPVFIDPQFSAPRDSWAYANQANYTYTTVDHIARVGLNPSCCGILWRQFFQFNIDQVAGTHILSAHFDTLMVHSYDCTSRPVGLFRTDGIPSGWYEGRLTWAGPALREGLNTQSGHAHDPNDQCGHEPDLPMSFPITAQMQGWANLRWGQVTLGLVSGNEGNVNNWQKFWVPSTALVVTYNSTPNVPDTLTTQGQSCVTGTGRPVVATSTPTLSARVSDPDGAAEGDINGVLRGEFAWEQQNLSTGIWSALGSATGVPQANGTTSPSPAPTFANGGIYRWHARGADSWSLPGVGSGTDYSVWTGWCEFEVDTTPPNTPVLSGDAGNTPFVTGKTVRVTFSPGGSPADTDITGYTWWVVDGAGTHPATTVSGSTTTVDWTAIAGQGTIFVRAKDRIQTSVNAGSYGFNAAQPSTETARWPLSEASGSTAATDTTGNGHDATVTLTAPATLGAPGRIVNGTTALSLNGNSANVLTSPAVLDTTRNFTVSAWARLTDPSTVRGIASQDGVHTSGFRLEFNTFCTCWEFFMAGSDVASPIQHRAAAPTQAKLNVWTHLSGVYDAGADTVKLYINGAPVATAAGPAAPWNATGPLRIGRSQWNDNPVDFFTGGIADVRVWDRTLSNSEIAAMADPTDANNIATDVVGQYFVEPASCLGSPATVCQDSSGYAHDVNLSGGVTTTTAGHTGSGLQYNATNGVAQSTDPNTGGLGPVLHTDASFTVAAWVKLDSMPNGNRTAIGQSGTKMSPFYFGTRISGTTPYWAFAMVDTDTDNTAWRTAWSSAAITTADVGQWFHLVGVYDAYTGTISLYVNGTLAGSATRTAAPWDAAGPLTIGAVLWTPAGSTPRLVDGWNGTIDTVTIYAGAVPPASISRIP